MRITTVMDRKGNVVSETFTESEKKPDLSIVVPMFVESIIARAREKNSTKSSSEFEE